MLTQLRSIHTQIAMLTHTIEKWFDNEDVKLVVNRVGDLLEKISQHDDLGWKSRCNVLYFKRRIIENISIFHPEWVVWDRNETTLTFVQMRVDEDRISVVNDLHMELRPHSDEQYLTIRCVSRTVDMNTCINVELSELLPQIFAILRSCHKTSVFIEENVCISSGTLSGMADLSEKAIKFESPDVEFENEQTNSDCCDFEVKTETGLSEQNYHWDVTESTRVSFKKSKKIRSDQHPVGKKLVKKSRSSSKVKVKKPRINENSVVGEDDKPCLADIVEAEEGCEDDGETKKGQTGNEERLFTDDKGSDITENPDSKTPASSDVRRKKSSDLSDEDVQKIEVFGKDDDDRAPRKNDAFLPCRLCSVNIAVNRGSRHLLRKHDIKSLACCFCDSTFKNQSQLQKHCRLIHGKIKKLPCRICGKVISRTQSINHMAIAHEKDGCECCFCPSKFKKKDVLENHVRQYHTHLDCKSKSKCQDGRPCRLCGVLISRADEFWHMEIFHNKPLECPLCEFKVEDSPDFSKMHVQDMVHLTSQPTALYKIKRHIRLAHKRENRNCKHCGSSFQSPYELFFHRRKCKLKNRNPPKLVLCNLCGEMIDQEKMSNHKFFQHYNHEEFSCPKCSKKFLRGEYLRKHLLVAHFPEKGALICPTCNKACCDKASFRRHIRTHGKPEIECTRDGCSKKVKRQCNVLQHLQGRTPLIRLKSRP